MLKYRKIPILTEVKKSVKCDVCGKEYFYGNIEHEWQIQEFVSFAGCGGYGSVIGDMCEWSIDICQHCFVEKLGDCIQYFHLQEGEEE